VKRYEFSLEIALRARRAQESVARNDLMRSHMLSASAGTAADNSRAHYEDVISSAGATFMAQRERAVLAAQALTDAQASAAEARDAVTGAMEQYLSAAQDVSVIEHLDERRREEHALATQREEAANNDELTINRHVRDNRLLKKRTRR
jgi:flagellar biosynthesis chaperone FliJ